MCVPDPVAALGRCCTQPRVSGAPVAAGRPASGRPDAGRGPPNPDPKALRRCEVAPAGAGAEERADQLQLLRQRMPRAAGPRGAPPLSRRRASEPAAD